MANRKNRCRRCDIVNACRDFVDRVIWSRVTFQYCLHFNALAVPQTDGISATVQLLGWIHVSQKCCINSNDFISIFRAPIPFPITYIGDYMMPRASANSRPAASVMCATCVHCIPRNIYEAWCAAYCPSFFPTHTHTLTLSFHFFLIFGHHGKRLDWYAYAPLQTHSPARTCFANKWISVVYAL